MANFDTAGIRKQLPDHLILRNSDAFRLLQTARNNRYGLRDFVLIALLFRHGLSVRALIELRPEHVKNGYLVHRCFEKTCAYTPLHPLIIRALPNLLDETTPAPLLFRSQQGGPIKRQAVNYIIEVSSRKANVAPFSPTELRHLCGYNLAAAGFSKTEIRNALSLSGNGHVNRYFAPWA